jgi:hypothetical protein
MPRKENIPLEERLQKARETFIRKQEEKDKRLSQLTASKIYKLARKSCIFFVWITQLILIDWLLPYTETGDKIKDGYQIKEIKSGSLSFKEGSLNITTQQNKKLELLLDEESHIPEINDSIFVLNSLLLHEAKKVKDVNKNQTYLVSGSLTYIMLPVIIIFFGLSLLFLFIRNIEIKAFYYFMFIANIVATLILLTYYILVN